MEGVFTGPSASQRAKRSDGAGFKEPLEHSMNMRCREAISQLREQEPDAIAGLGHRFRRSTVLRGGGDAGVDLTAVD
jgi:hypothetical protein